jgi:hypothetical protein
MSSAAVHLAALHDVNNLLACHSIGLIHCPRVQLDRLLSRSNADKQGGAEAVEHTGAMAAAGMLAQGSAAQHSTAQVFHAQVFGRSFPFRALCSMLTRDVEFRMTAVMVFAGGDLFDCPVHP